jgi:hypothetical protein
VHSATRLAPDAIAAIVEGRHTDPFAVLGPHDANGAVAVRAFVPGAETLDVLPRDGDEVVHLTRRHAAGFFDGELPRRTRWIVCIVEISWLEVDAMRRLRKVDVAIRRDRRFREGLAEERKRETGRQQNVDIAIVTIERKPCAARCERRGCAFSERVRITGEHGNRHGKVCRCAFVSLVIKLTQSQRSGRVTIRDSYVRRLC